MPDMAFQDLLRAQEEAEEVSLSDPQQGIFRMARIRDKKLVSILFLESPPDQPRWTILQKAFAAGELDSMNRKFLLSGRSLDGAVDEGPTVCACFGVPRDRILNTIRDGASSLAPLQSKLKAGTNCGSCIPELKRLLAAQEALALALT
jgi:assimilatory nitrate reductase catalytic subunit